MPTTEITELNNKIMEQLGELGGKRAAAEEVTYGKGFTVPDLYRGKLDEAADRLHQIHQEQEEIELFVRTFPYKPWDVAVATTNVFKQVFGVSVVQRSSFFQPSGFRDIPVSPTETVKAPFGEIVLLTFNGAMTIASHKDSDGYHICQVVVECPKKYEHQVNGLWYYLDEELKNNSIYRGKAIDGSSMPNFLDLSNVAIENIIYSRFTMRQLEANLWAPIQYPFVCRDKGLDPKRAVLLQGPYGTGKTLGAMYTAKVCEAVSRTFIMCNPKDNNAFECLRTAALYQPSCLFVEDIDKLASTDDRNAMAQLLDEFDGLKAKGRDIVIVLTTNKAHEIHKGMLRPGRMDAIIEIGNLDLQGTSRLIKSLFTDNELANDLDFEKIHTAMDGFTPAFMKEVGQKVKLYSIARVGGGEIERYTTEDFEAAAKEMRVHFDLHTGAGELVRPPAVDDAIGRKVLEVLDHMPVVTHGTDEIRFEMAPALKDNGKKE